MKFPNLNEEKKLWKKGVACVVGLDEAGRGPLAGPVVAAAVFLKPNSKNFLRGINDSKLLSEKQRDYFYNILISHKDVEWGIGVVSEKIIDKINILEASKLAMQKALNKIKTNPGFLLIDGNFKIKSEISQQPIIKGDQKVISISAAAVLAKVHRDRLMEKYDKKYPGYGFAKHKGYPTAEHRKKISELGLCKIHRKSFSFV